MIVFAERSAQPGAPERAEALPPPSPAVSSQLETNVWRMVPLEGLFEFSYLDAAGRPSLRRLRAGELKVGPGKLLLGGIDDALGAYRGFRVDRIDQLRAVDTGETVSRNILDWLLERAARQARGRQAGEKARRGGERSTTNCAKAQAAA